MIIIIIIIIIIISLKTSPVHELPEL